MILQCTWWHHLFFSSSKRSVAIATVFSVSRYDWSQGFLTGSHSCGYLPFISIHFFGYTNSLTIIRLSSLLHLNCMSNGQNRQNCSFTIVSLKQENPAKNSELFCVSETTVKLQFHLFWFGLTSHYIERFTVENTNSKGRPRSVPQPHMTPYQPFPGNRQLKLWTRRTVLN